MSDRYYSRSSRRRPSSGSSSKPTRSYRSSRKKNPISLPQLIIMVLFLVVVAQLGFLMMEAEEEELSRFEAVELKSSTKTVRQDNWTQVHHVINGNLYLVEVKPKVGSAYYLVDQLGQGRLELRRDPSGLKQRPPEWALQRW